MSDQSESPILLLGLAGTGKTHFLVGLDIILDNQTDPNGLVHSDHSADRAYVQPLREQWHRGEDLDHTSRQSPPTPHELLVVHPATETRATFHIPDLAGEGFGDHFATRSFPYNFGMQLKVAKGLILFLHCDHEADHTLHGHPGFIDPVQSNETNDASSKPGQATEWSIELASRQAKLVDLLQFVAEIRQIPLRVAVAISAWDLVENAPSEIANEMPKNPASFLVKRWPLLNQFLESNSETFPNRTFGVSARGGGHTPEEISRLTGLINPRERIILVDGEHRSNDLTRPVSWILGLLDAPTPPNG